MNGVNRFIKIVIWILFVGFILFLLSSGPGRKPVWSPAEQFLIEITAPIQQGILKLVDAIEDFWLNYFYLVSVRQDNLRLMAAVDALKMENSRYRELLSTHKRLEKLLQFKQTTHWPVLAARVIGLDPTGWFKSVIINKGEKAGIEMDMPVVNASGVVGRVVSLSPNYAKVLLVIDQNSGVDCLVQRSRDRGILKGLSTEICKLCYVVKSSDVAVGDKIVTSGLGGVFPKGIPVGEVRHVREMSGNLFKDIDVRPEVDFSRLEEVLVILKEAEPLPRQKEGS